MENSDFFKTIEQFYKQNRSSQNPKDRYILITTNDTSKKITNDFKKLTKSIRLNIDATLENPQSTSEKDTLEKITNTFNAICKKNNHTPLTPESLNAILRKIYIITLDLEQGGTYENAFLATITCRLSTRPELLWNHIIASCLDWSKNRQSVDVSGISKLLKNFSAPSVSDAKEDYTFSVTFDPENFTICSGREVLLIENPHTDNEMTLIEERRFNEDGSFRLRFDEASVEMPDGKKFKLFARFSTLKGAARFLGETYGSEKKINIINTLSLAALDDEAIAKSYSEKIRLSISKTTEISKCIHCDDGLSHELLHIEVNETGLPFDTGFIHTACRRSSDRVLGRGKNPGAEQHPELKSFDYRKWFISLPESQALWGSFKDINTKIKNIVWSPNQTYQQGTHCIRVNLADGSTRIIQHRGQVERFTSEEADAACLRFTHQGQEAREKMNPLCYSSNGDTFSDRRSIMENHRDPMPPIECMSYEKISYTRGLAALHNTCKNFYAPILLMLTEKGSPRFFKDTAFLITDPFNLKNSLANWKVVDSSLDAYNLKIIEDDKEFDKLLFKLRENHTSVLVDPLFDANGHLFSGATIQHIDDVMINFAPAWLYRTCNEDNTDTYILKNKETDELFLISENCQRINCLCLGCKILYSITKKYGSENCNTRRVDKSTTLTAVDAEILSVWSASILECPAHLEGWEELEI